MSDTIKISEDEAKKQVGIYAVHQYRKWSDEHRIIHKIAAPYSIPPANSGRRVSKHLTNNAARKMSSSCEYVSLKKGGYTTFLTLTFDAEARKRLSNGGTVQREVSRFFDAAQKVYQRGWDCELENGDFERVEGKKDKLDYLWVVENPESYTDLKTGEIIGNPHLHVLMRWNVDYSQFKSWAKRIEKIWGQGFAHLEKLKSRKRETAAAYLMKALKYVAKAANGADQGIVHGNRYGISKSARAPEWDTLYCFAWCKLGKLIEEARFKQNQKRKPLEKKRDDLKVQLSEAKTKKQKSAINKMLEKIKDKIKKEKGDIYYGRNRVLCQGGKAKDLLFSWFKKKGFEWFDKPLSLYSYYLNKKLKKEKEKMQAFIDWNKNSGFETREACWLQKMEKDDYADYVFN